MHDYVTKLYYQMDMTKIMSLSLIEIFTLRDGLIFVQSTMMITTMTFLLFLLVGENGILYREKRFILGQDY